MKKYRWAQISVLICERYDNEQAICANLCVYFSMKVITNSVEETIGLGKKLGKHLKAGDVLGLVGELGSGKTTLVKGIASGLRVLESEEVTSPSFVLIKEYAGKIPLFHFDLYRLDKMKDIEYLGLEEYLFDQGVCIIEWAEKMKMLLPDYLQIDLTIKGENKREIKLFAHNKRYEALLKRLQSRKKEVKIPEYR